MSPADPALWTRNTLDDYSKSRVAIGSFEGPDELCRCILELFDRHPALLDLFVLTPTGNDRSNLHRSCTTLLPDPVRKRLFLIAAGQQGSPDSPRRNDSLSAEHGSLRIEVVMNFAEWLDLRSIRRLQQTLSAGNILLFVQVNNVQQESDSFESLRRHCTGAVLLHDLPPDKGIPQSQR